MEQELRIGNMLIDFYVKFSLLAEAQVLFSRLVTRDIISWTALLGGYAHKGFTNDVFFIFGRMKEEGITPNAVTFVHVLYACNHAGLVKKSQSYFEAITEEYGLTPEIDHYTCIISLLVRAGHTDKAVSMMRKMPIQPDLVMWQAVLGACSKRPTMELTDLLH
ncbi:hypothetical protein GOP47_0023395 [Adiantum capillus-veneris]|uniref:Pentatricopeptide repeat-containing protein n=1 Tax=Adiantum capillus-veneris TaxID=13818 RepID=A0A9D4U3W6_ADICA|nr:hypothetical protein GOP47_0023395 [Adiantum capillus-veneris]